MVEQIKVYRNPSEDVVNINSPVNVGLQLTTIDGRVLFTKENATTFSVKEYAEGIYFLSIMDKDNRLIKVEKIVKQ